MWKCHCMEDLFKIPGVTWGVLHQCAFGMKDPVDKLAYKKATCLVHNFAEDQLAPTNGSLQNINEHMSICRYKVQRKVMGLGPSIPKFTLTSSALP